MTTDQYGRFWQQLDEVRLQNPGRNLGVHPRQCEPGGSTPPGFVYESARLLCRANDIERVTPHLSRPVDEVSRVDDHVSLLTLAHDDPAEIDIAEQVTGVHRGLAHRYSRATPALVTPHHLLSITPVAICPADEPVPVQRYEAPWPERSMDMAAGEGIEILVVDTGMVHGFLNGHPWLAGVVEGQPEGFYRGGALAGREPHWHGSYDERGLIKEYAGHGMFVAGVIGCIAPSAQIRVSNALDRAGAMLEAELGAALLSALGTGKWPHIISLSAGAPTHDGHPLLGLSQFMAELEKHPETVLVAAAGNDALRDTAGAVDVDAYHFWPAANAPFTRAVVSVGALRRHDDSRACFSNFGSSVSVYARGEEHVNAFLHGEYEYHHDLPNACRNHEPSLYGPCSCTTSLPYHAHAIFQGMARWSGTSFATPLVAGRLAAYMSRQRATDARKAAQEMIEQESKLIPDVWAGPTAPEQIRAFL
jgi:subtilisin family serine protease